MKNYYLENILKLICAKNKLRIDYILKIMKIKFIDNKLFYLNFKISVSLSVRLI